MQSPEVGKASGTGVAAGWLARIALLLGGVGLAVRLGVPAVVPGSRSTPNEDRTEALGRGKPATPPSRKARGAGHETADLSGGTLGRLVLGLGCAAVTMVFIMVFVQRLLLADHRRAEPHLTAEQLVRIAPPAPTLQANPVEELAALHGREAQLLYNYAWIDDAHTRGRIPVGRAMTLILGHKLDTAP